MEVTLVIVTLVSLALAMAMGVIAWRLLHEERLRATARVTALEQGLAESLRTNPPTPDPIAGPLVAAVARVSGNGNTLHVEPLIRDDTDWLAQFPASTAPRASVAADEASERRLHAAGATARDAHINGLDADPASRDAGRGMPVAGKASDAIVGSHAAARDPHRRGLDASAPSLVDAFGGTPLADAEEDAVDASTANDSSSARAGLFAQTAEPPADAGLSRRIAAIAAVAAVVIGAVLASWVIGRVVAPRVDPGSGTNVAGTATAGPAALELVSLRHEQQDGTLTITGLVRNPYGGAAQERLTAVVFFFDGQGGFLSSTRAPLDFRTLAPGEESPFQLSAPAPPNVARYRVSFRREEGAIVPHVDRRQQEASRS